MPGESTEKSPILSDQSHSDQEHSDQEESSGLGGCFGCGGGKDDDFTLEKCGKASVDTAIVAISRWHTDDLIGNDHNKKHEDADGNKQVDPQLDPGVLIGFGACSRWISFDKIELLVAIGIYYTVLCVQATLVWIFFKEVVEFREDKWEPEYIKAMKMHVENATILKSSLATAGSRNMTETLLWCRLNRAPPFLHLMCVWLWCGVAINLVMQALYRFYLIGSLEQFKHKDGESQHNHTHPVEPGLDPPPGEKQIKVNIQYMSNMQKLCTMTFVLLPNFLLQCMLAWTGLKYVSVTTQVNLLVKASLKMNFIANMDKILLPAYISYNWENTVMVAQYKVRAFIDEDGTVGWLVNRWPSTVIRCLLSLGLGWYLAMIMWPVIEEFRLLCKNYFELFPEENVLSKPRPFTPVTFINDNPWNPNI